MCSSRRMPVMLLSLLLAACASTPHKVRLWHPGTYRFEHSGRSGELDLRDDGSFTLSLDATEFEGPMRFEGRWISEWGDEASVSLHVRSGAQGPGDSTELHAQLAGTTCVLERITAAVPCGTLSSFGMSRL